MRTHEKTRIARTPSRAESAVLLPKAANDLAECDEARGNKGSRGQNRGHDPAVVYQLGKSAVSLKSELTG